jgi:hypothetical protein
MHENNTKTAMTTCDNCLTPCEQAHQRVRPSPSRSSLKRCSAPRQRRTREHTCTCRLFLGRLFLVLNRMMFCFRIGAASCAKNYSCRAIRGALHDLSRPVQHAEHAHAPFHCAELSPAKGTSAASIGALPTPRSWNPPPAIPPEKSATPPTQNKLI